MTFDQEVWPRLRFPNDPLKVVVVQVRYPTAHALNDPSVQAAIQRSISDRFPTSMPAVQEVTFAVTPQGPTTPQVAQTAVRFGDVAEARVLAIGPAMASFETTRYDGWETFEPEIEQLLAIVAEHGAPTRYTRLGLRYVDEIVVEGVSTMTDWGQLLSERLLGAPDSLTRDPRAVETSQKARIEIGDDVVTVQHGYTQSIAEGWGSVSAYVLDTDISTATPGPWDIPALLERAGRFHGWMTSIFGRSLSPAGVERLGGTCR